MSPIKYMFVFGTAGCATVLGTLEYFRNMIHRDFLENGPTCSAGKKLFYSNRTVKDILGVPIKEHPIETFDGRLNFDNDYECQIHVRVEGTKSKGNIYMKGMKNVYTEEWHLKELCLKSEDLQTTIYSIIPPEKQE